MQLTAKQGRNNFAGESLNELESQKREKRKLCVTYFHLEAVQDTSLTGYVHEVHLVDDGMAEAGECPEK